MNALMELIERHIDEVNLSILTGGMTKEEYDIAINTRFVYLSVIDMIKDVTQYDEDEND